jgi:hypothetical protein
LTSFSHRYSDLALSNHGTSQGCAQKVSTFLESQTVGENSPEFPFRWKFCKRSKQLHAFTCPTVRFTSFLEFIIDVLLAGKRAEQQLKAWETQPRFYVQLLVRALSSFAFNTYISVNIAHLLQRDASGHGNTMACTDLHQEWRRSILAEIIEKVRSFVISDVDDLDFHSGISASDQTIMRSMLLNTLQVCSAVRFKSLFESKKVIEYEKNLRIQKKRINKRVFALIYAFAPFFRL